MKVQGVGHVVLKVRDLDRSARFYTGVLGLKEVARFPGRMVFFSAGTNHHDLAVMAVGAMLEANQVKIRGLRDHHVSQSIYLEDPDGNQIELFVDADPAIWSEDPTTVATSKPLTLR